MPQQPPPQSPQPDQPTPPSSTPESTGASPAQPTGRSTPPAGTPGPRGYAPRPGYAAGPTQVHGRVSTSGGYGPAGRGPGQPPAAGAPGGWPAPGYGPAVPPPAYPPGTGSPIPPGRPVGPVHPTQAYAAPAGRGDVRGDHGRRGAGAEEARPDRQQARCRRRCGGHQRGAGFVLRSGGHGRRRGAGIGVQRGRDLAVPALARQDPRHRQGPRQASRRPHRQRGEHDRGAGAAGGRGRFHDAGVRHAR